MYKFNESKNLQWAELIFCLSSGRLVVVAWSKNPLSARCIKTNLTLQDTVWMPNNFWLCIPKMAAFPELGRQFLVFVLLSALIAPFTNSWHQTFSLFYHFFFFVYRRQQLHHSFGWIWWAAVLNWRGFMCVLRLGTHCLCYFSTIWMQKNNCMATIFSRVL